MVYYNEFDRHKAAWLRELIARDLIAPGVVDERSIRDVQPGDLAGYAQCHFFAGIGIWSYALRLAGWPDDRECWTASCPCQPFSAAGKRKGTQDQRHLWPEVARLVEGVRPVVLVGEQVAGPDGLAWLDLVCDDLERCAYTPGAVVSPACSYGAPHDRERLYWVALSDAEGRGCGERGHAARAGGGRHTDGGCKPDGVADSASARPSERRDGRESARAQCAATERDCGSGSLEHGDGERLPRGLQRDGEPQPGGETGGERLDADRSGEADGVGNVSEDGLHEIGWPGKADGEWWLRQLEGSGATRGAWAGADWVLCRPQRVGDPPSLRPVKSSAQRLAHGDTGGMVRCRNSGFPLAEGEEARTLRLKGYGDAIVSSQAAAFIRAVMEEMEA